MSKVILLASGGLDSTTLAYSLIESGISIRPLFFDYGQHCVEKEWDALSRVLAQKNLTAERISLGNLLEGSKSLLVREANLWSDEVTDDDLYLPYRTLLLFTAGAVRAQIAGITEVYSAFINSNYAKELDCSAAYFNGLDSLSQDIGAVRFRLPFRDFTKEMVVKKAMELGVPIGHTFSCQVYSDIPCGACPNCVERINALEGVMGEL